MTRGPGQGMPLHDHGGMWCIEGVFRGSIEVRPYELVERHGKSLGLDDAWAARRELRGARGRTHVIVAHPSAAGQAAVRVEQVGACGRVGGEQRVRSRRRHHRERRR